ncbi:hypothetical protein [Rhizobium leguminosarum]|uniref:hypothetical protein n=1 Tax=Rhizobium leguminosarum TaxID=384 RepID=UPI0013EEE674|nr:hypothetical protein [Rhizobium leguminosarum]
MDLLIRRWRIEIEQGFYISAHDLLPVIVSLPSERRVASTENSRASVNGNRSTAELYASQGRVQRLQFGLLSLWALEPDHFGSNRPEI